MLYTITMVLLHGGSKKQTYAATSTIHAEYIALYTCTKEVVWRHRLLATSNDGQISPTMIFSDSQSAIWLAANPKYHARTKHIDIKYHYIRNEIIYKSIVL